MESRLGDQRSFTLQETHECSAPITDICAQPNHRSICSFVSPSLYMCSSHPLLRMDGGDASWNWLSSIWNVLVLYFVVDVGMY